MEIPVQIHVCMHTHWNYIYVQLQFPHLITGPVNQNCLLLLQDICVQCVFAGLEWSGLSQLTENLRSDASHKTLYSPQCLLSALRTARKITQAKQSRTLISNVKHPSIELTKGDNSGVFALCVCVCVVCLCL